MEHLGLAGKRLLSIIKNITTLESLFEIFKTSRGFTLNSGVQSPSTGYKKNQYSDLLISQDAHLHSSISLDRVPPA